MDSTDGMDARNPTRGDVWRNILRMSDLLRAIVARDTPKDNLNRITVNQARIFAYLFQCRAEGRPVRIKTLAHDLDVTPAAASQAVERLVAFGVVERTVDPDDRRAVLLSFSEKGNALLRWHERRAEELLDSLAGECPPEDFAVFARVLGRLTEGMAARWAAILDGKEGEKTNLESKRRKPTTGEAK